MRREWMCVVEMMGLWLLLCSNRQPTSMTTTTQRPLTQGVPPHGVALVGKRSVGVPSCLVGQTTLSVYSSMINSLGMCEPDCQIRTKFFDGNPLPLNFFATTAPSFGCLVVVLLDWKFSIVHWYYDVYALSPARPKERLGIQYIVVVVVASVVGRKDNPKFMML